MDLNKKTITELVLEWLIKEPYSKQHWETVAKECLEKTTNDLDKSIKLMADSIKQFHHLYISKVVRENNLLHDLLTHCFDKVQWDKVAKHFFNKAS